MLHVPVSRLNEQLAWLFFSLTLSNNASIHQPSKGINLSTGLRNLGGFAACLIQTLLQPGLQRESWEDATSTASEWICESDPLFYRSFTFWHQFTGWKVLLQSESQTVQNEGATEGARCQRAVFITFIYGRLSASSVSSTTRVLAAEYSWLSWDICCSDIIATVCKCDWKRLSVTENIVTSDQMHV